MTDKRANPKEQTANGKAPLWLLPRPALELVSRAFEAGLTHEDRIPYNWRIIPIKASTYISASNRHEAKWLEGEEWDNDTPIKVHHLAADIASKLILLDSILAGSWIDDRPPTKP